MRCPGSSVSLEKAYSAGKIPPNLNLSTGGTHKPFLHCHPNPQPQSGIWQLWREPYPQKKPAAGWATPHSKKKKHISILSYGDGTVLATYFLKFVGKSYQIIQTFYNTKTLIEHA